MSAGETHWAEGTVRWPWVVVGTEGGKSGQGQTESDHPGSDHSPQLPGLLKEVNTPGIV